MNEIIQGDSLTILSSFLAESVDCCITSPPYWGLRDYGTGVWEGGSDTNCDHKIPSVENNKKHPNGDSSHTTRFNRESCYKCGAKRIDSQLGLEKTPEEYVANMVKVFSEVKRVLKKEGTLWLNLGDTYSAARWSSGQGQPMNKNKDLHRAGKETEARQSGLPDKNLVGIPWRVALALQADGWILRQDIIWNKPNPMPESVTDRCTKTHEYVFLMSKQPKYYFDNDSIREPSLAESVKHHTKYAGKHYRKKDYGDDLASKTKWEHRAPNPLGRNKRSVWTITTKPFREAHFATFPEDLIVPMVKAGCPPDGVVLDPFMGAGTTGLVARKLQRNYLGIELNPAYVEMARKRIGEIEKQPVLI